MAFLTYVYLFAVVFIADSMQSSYLPCDGKPAPKNVNILGCSSLPCNLKRGTDVEATFDFEISADTKTLKPDVVVQLGSILTPYPFPEQNACKSLVHGQCPLEKGEVATYHMKMPIQKSYPKIDMIIQFGLLDDDKNTQACFKIPAKIVD